MRTKNYKDFCPTKQTRIVAKCAMILVNFLLAFWEKQWPHKFILNLTDLYVNQLFIVLRLAQRFLALESALQLRKTNCSCPNWMSWKIPKVHLCNIFCGHRRPIMFSSIFYSLPSNNFKCIILTFTVQTDFFSYMRIHCGSWSVLRGILLFLCSFGFFCF